jgi:hypothetical protein
MPFSETYARRIALNIGIHAGYPQIIENEEVIRNRIQFSAVSCQFSVQSSQVLGVGGWGQKKPSSDLRPARSAFLASILTILPKMREIPGTWAILWKPLILQEMPGWGGKRGLDRRSEVGSAKGAERRKLVVTQGAGRLEHVCFPCSLCDFNRRWRHKW